jgi:hypothetical protein
LVCVRIDVNEDGHPTPSTPYRRITTNKQALNNLAQFTGTENYHRHLGIQYTDGVQFLAQNADCYWLLDAIASYQPGLCQNPRLVDFQFWALKVSDHSGFSSAVLTCTDGDSEVPVITQQIQSTDFPLPSIKLYVERGVLLLPSEH